MPNKEFLEKAKACASKEEFLNASKGGGYNFTNEEVDKFLINFMEHQVLYLMKN